MKRKVYFGTVYLYVYRIDLLRKGSRDADQNKHPMRFTSCPAHVVIAGVGHNKAAPEQRPRASSRNKRGCIEFRVFWARRDSILCQLGHCKWWSWFQLWYLAGKTRVDILYSYQNSG